MSDFRFRDPGEKEFFDVLKKRLLITSFALEKNNKTYLTEIKKEMGINYLYLSKVLKILIDCGEVELMADSEKRNEEEIWVKLTISGNKKAREYVLLMEKK